MDPDIFMQHFPVYFSWPELLNDKYFEDLYSLDILVYDGRKVKINNILVDYEPIHTLYELFEVCKERLWYCLPDSDILDRVFPLKEIFEVNREEQLLAEAY